MFHFLTFLVSLFFVKRFFNLKLISSLFWAKDGGICVEWNSLNNEKKVAILSFSLNVFKCKKQTKQQQNKQNKQNNQIDQSIREKQQLLDALNKEIEQKTIILRSLDKTQTITTEDTDGWMHGENVSPLDQPVQIFQII